MITIKTIMDNLPSEQKSLKAEHGLSFYVKTEQVTILFDFGAGISTFENLEKMNVALNQITYAVGSHGHYDHAGGYPLLAEFGLVCPLVTGKGFFDEKYAKSKGKVTYLGTGFSETLLEQHSVRHLECEGMLKLAEGCYLIGAFELTHEFETIPERFVIRRNDRLRQDDFGDEICLVLDTDEGLVVIAGCSHPGILNMLTTVQKRLGRPIRAVIGGTHLVEADEVRIRKTLKEMKNMGIRFLGINHCSGQLVRSILEADQQIESVYLGVGDCLFFE